MDFAAEKMIRVFGIVFVLVLAASITVVASTVYNSAGTTVTVADNLAVQGNVTITGDIVVGDCINNVCYARNIGELQDVIDRVASDASLNTVKLYNGSTYDTDTQINLSSGVTLDLNGGFLITDADINLINISGNGNVTILGNKGRLAVYTTSYTKAAIYFSPTTTISSSKQIIISTDIYQVPYTTGTGTAIHLDGKDNSDGIAWIHVKDMIIEGFNKSIEITSTSSDGNGYINANIFENLIIKASSYPYFITVTGDNQVVGNQIRNNGVQSEANWKAAINITGRAFYNTFDMFVWDLNSTETYFEFGSQADGNTVMMNVPVGQYNDAGTNNLIIQTNNATIHNMRSLTLTEEISVGAAPEGIANFYYNTGTTGDGTGVNIEQDGSGDARLTMQLTGGEQYTMGIDNTDGDSFVISNHPVMGNGNRIRIDGTSGQLTFGATNYSTASAQYLCVNAGVVYASASACV